MAAALDVVVVGGGPAGSAAARLLAGRGWSVALAERSGFEGYRYGETLAPEVMPALRQAGFGGEILTTDALESPGVVSAWGSARPASRDFVANPYGGGWHVDRSRFDERLFGAAGDAGVRLLPRTRVKRVRRVQAPDPGWELATGNPAHPQLRTRFLVDTSGQTMLRPGGSGRRLHADVLLAVTVRLQDAAGASPDLRTVIEGAPAGWWYAAPVPGGERVVMFLTDPQAYRDSLRLPDQLAHAPLVAGLLSAGRCVDARLLPARSYLRSRTAGAGWIAAGDSACAYDPISGGGVVKALRSGVAAAGAVDRHLRGDGDALGAYERSVRKTFDAYLHRRHLVYGHEGRWPHAGFWARRSARGR